MALKTELGDILNDLARIAPSRMEMELLCSGFRLSPEQRDALLGAGSRHEREAVVAAALCDSVKELRSDRRGLGDLT